MKWLILIIFLLIIVLIILGLIYFPIITGKILFSTGKVIYATCKSTVKFCFSTSKKVFEKLSNRKKDVSVRSLDDPSHIHISEIPRREFKQSNEWNNLS